MRTSSDRSILVDGGVLVKSPMSYEEIISSLGKERFQNEMIFCDRLSPKEVLSAVIKSGAEKLVQKSNPFCDIDLRLVQVLQKNPTFFSIYPLSLIFGISEPSSQSEKELTKVGFHIDSVAEKRGILDVIEFHLLEFSASRDFSTKIAFVADELITNAIYDAPVAASGKSGKNYSRDYTVAIDPNKKPYVFLGHNKKRLVVGCKDFYGSLDVKRFLARIRECHDLAASDVLQTGAGGAGVGAYMAFSSCTNMYIDVLGGKSSLVCCSFPFTEFSKTEDQFFKNIICRETARP